jgi:DNA-directed RNA polymerase specialized sigma24 family protein
LQVGPQRQVSPQLQPPRRPVWFVFFAIRISFSQAHSMSAFREITQHRKRHYTDRMDHAEPAQEEPAAPLAILLENHRAFLKYLERRVGDRELAEDILQDAFVKVMDRPDQAPADEGVVPWFYRTLRNAAIDQFRRRGTANRAVEAFAREIEAHTAAAPDMEAESAPASAAWPRP